MLPAILFAQYSWDNLTTVKETSFKTDTFSIKQFFAVADGNTLNTESINNANTVCNKNGGGVVEIPAGLWLTLPVEMKCRSRSINQANEGSGITIKNAEILADVPRGSVKMK